jgi:surface antigen
VKTWFFAPEVGHYVLTSSKYYYRQNPRRQELLAVLPPLDGITPEARQKMDRSFQTALEFNKRGESVRWSNQQTGISGEIMASHTFKTSDGKYYRRYIQKLKLPDSHRTYYGMAVRGSDGVWAIPRR